jgi:RNA polymerase sigma-70 factor (ECF subfamily)
VKSESKSTATACLDSDLIKRAQQGDSSAFATLFDTHKMRIYSLCLRMTNNVAEAEDLTQDAFLQVFRKLASFRGDSALSTWLHRVAVNTVLMHFRKNSPCQVSLDEPYSNHENAKPIRREFGNRDGRLENSVTRVALIRAISELPDGYRTIFLMHEVQGYEHREIAELLGCSVGNSKSQLHKAKLRVRGTLVSLPGVRAETGRLEHPGTASSLSRPAPMIEKWKLPISQGTSVNSMLPFAPSNA